MVSVHAMHTKKGSEKANVRIAHATTGDYCKVTVAVTVRPVILSVAVTFITVPEAPPGTVSTKLPGPLMGGVGDTVPPLVAMSYPPSWGDNTGVSDPPLTVKRT